MNRDTPTLHVNAQNKGVGLRGELGFSLTICSFTSSSLPALHIPPPQQGPLMPVPALPQQVILLSAFIQSGLSSSATPAEAGSLSNFRVFVQGSDALPGLSSFQATPRVCQEGVAYQVSHSGGTCPLDPPPPAGQARDEASIGQTALPLRLLPVWRRVQLHRLFL